MDKGPAAVAALPAAVVVVEEEEVVAVGSVGRGGNLEFVECDTSRQGYRKEESGLTK
jgi:hypothetical protein